MKITKSELRSLIKEAMTGSALTTGRLTWETLDPAMKSRAKEWLESLAGRPGINPAPLILDDNTAVVAISYRDVDFSGGALVTVWGLFGDVKLTQGGRVHKPYASWDTVKLFDERDYSSGFAHEAIRRLQSAADRSDVLQ